MNDSQNPNPSPTEAEVAAARKWADQRSRIRHLIAVMSGKGGVGKSTVAVNLAVSLMLSGKRVGLLDADLHGPSIPTMLGLEDERIQAEQGELIPVEIGGLKVMSLGFFLRHPDDPVIWRGPVKMGAIKQLLQETAWGDLDYLIMDLPPGTGDEPLSICQLAGPLTGTLVVTTPQRAAAVDVRKAIGFCRRLGVPVLGLVENMDGFACPTCGTVTAILPSGGGRNIADDFQVPYLGSVPLDPRIAECGDSGRAFLHQYADTPAARRLRDVLLPLLRLDASAGAEPTTKPGGTVMRIAIPLAQGRLAQHFGHCEQFALLDVDSDNRRILHREDVLPPPHEPGLLPRWLAEKKAEVILAGGMGQRAQELFSGQGIRVVVGVPTDSPETLVDAFLAGTLSAGTNRCDH